MAKESKQLAKLIKENTALKQGNSLRAVAAAAAKQQGTTATLKREVLKTCMSGTMQVLTKSFGTVGPVPLMIDTAAGLLGAGMMALAKGGMRRFGQDVVVSSVNAHVARAIWSPERFSVWAGKVGVTETVANKVRDIGEERAKRSAERDVVDAVTG